MLTKANLYICEHVNFCLCELKNIWNESI